jgi:hypothetical protein
MALKFPNPKVSNVKKTTLMIASLLVALAGSAQAQAPAAPAAPAAAPTDPIVQLRLETKEADKAYSDKKRALNSERNAKVKAAGDKASADAKATGSDPAVAKRDAESKVKASTKADHDTKLKALKKEHSDTVAAIKKKYPVAKS